MRRNPNDRRAWALGIGAILAVSACRGAGRSEPTVQPAPSPAPPGEGSPANPPTSPPARSLPAPSTPETASPTREPAPTRAPFRDEEIAWNQTRVMELLGTIAREATDTRYLHTTIVDPARGIYYFDCSGMAAWVLRRAAPFAYVQVVHGLGDRRPVASTFEHAIRRAPAKASRGWQRVLRVADTEPGDVIAWLKPPIVRSGNTGHIGFVVLPPEELSDRGLVAVWGPEGEQHWLELGGAARAYLLRIADATRLHHLDDSRSEENRSGFGFGTILVVSDEAGAPAAYGWVGPRGNIFSTSISIGRPLS